MVLGSGSGTATGLGLLDIALGDAILTSLTILCLGSDGQLGCGSLGKEPWVTVIWSLQQLPGAIYEEKNSHGPC